MHRRLGSDHRQATVRPGRAGPGARERDGSDQHAGKCIKFDDQGEHELKGVPAMWRLFALES
jgi:hypothetical protein